MVRPLVEVLNMNLKHLTDEALLAETEKAVKIEKLATLAVLYHLNEIERRRLFAELKFSSLFEYAKVQLGYDGNDAYRRISAMRLLAELPEIAPAVESGKLSLTHLNLAQTHFNKEKKARGENLTREQKKEVLRKVVGVSTRAAEKVIAQSASYSETKMVTIQVDKELASKLQLLRGLLAHSEPNISDGELLHKVADMAIEKLSAPGKSSIPAGVRKDVWTRDGGKCTQCGSQHAVQYDHFPIPKSMGGPDTADNLRLRCRNCNQRGAIEFFSAGKMDAFLRH